MRADYVIGCDGGRSTVRKLADIGFEGFTYPERFIKIATQFDVATLNRNLVLRNYFSDPYEWCNLFKVQRRGAAAGCGARSFRCRRARTTTPRCGRSDRGAAAEILPKAAAATRLAYVNVYGVHQRVAATFRHGRVLLAGDSRPRQQPDRRHGHERRHP